MQQLKALACFVAVAQNRSIRAAADSVHLSSSALNRQVLELEAALGAPLFERHARGVRLSAAGEAYLPYARRALREAELGQAHIDALRDLRKGHVRLAAVSAVADERLVGLVARFQRAHPQVQFTLLSAGSADVLEAVLAHEADLGLVYNMPPHADIRELARRTYALHALVARDHPLAGKASVSLADLVEYPIALGDRSWGGRRLLDDYLRRTGLELRPQLLSNSVDVLAKYVQATGGACFQIRPDAAPPDSGDGLVALRVVELHKQERALVLGCLKGRALPPAVARFAEVLAQQLLAAPAPQPA